MSENAEGERQKGDILLFRRMTPFLPTAAAMDGLGLRAGGGEVLANDYCLPAPGLNHTPALPTWRRNTTERRFPFLNRLNHQHINDKVESDQNARIGALVSRTRKTMTEFLRRATEQKIAQLSDLVTTSFRFLLHKQQLVEKVVIHPDDFSITLLDSLGAILPKDQLSEGEKQIFAISVLWGLSQASARPLPAIIDTPMGRLDSEHRNQLVERYFPHASHQVILLSTDTEIGTPKGERQKGDILLFRRMMPFLPTAAAMDGLGLRAGGGEVLANDYCLPAPGLNHTPALPTWRRNTTERRFPFLNRLNHQHINDKVESDQNARIGALVSRTRKTMTEFLRRATEQKIARLSDLVTTSFRFLLHKQQLDEKVVIHPDDFSITLLDSLGAILPKDQLSEGEKQIFAISVLWGLSQASARPLPAIIDTPMGRLDSEHRNQLVERYFPHASHQVILLSTDTEIEVKYFEQLKPCVARAYHLNYDEAGRMTKVEEGYFWQRVINGVDE